MRGLTPKCALCGYVLENPSDAQACGQCAVLGACSAPKKDDLGGVLLRCPRCGYEWVEESFLVNGIRRLWNKWGNFFYGITKRAH